MPATVQTHKPGMSGCEVVLRSQDMSVHRYKGTDLLEGHMQGQCCMVNVEHLGVTVAVSDKERPSLKLDWLQSLTSCKAMSAVRPAPGQGRSRMA